MTTVAETFAEAIKRAEEQERYDVLERLLDGMAEINPVVEKREAEVAE